MMSPLEHKVNNTTTFCVLEEEPVRATPIPHLYHFPLPAVFTLFQTHACKEKESRFRPRNSCRDEESRPQGRKNKKARKQNSNSKCPKNSEMEEYEEKRMKGSKEKQEVGRKEGK